LNEHRNYIWLILGNILLQHAMRVNMNIW
jgi:hypothetical protein